MSIHHTYFFATLISVFHQPPPKITPNPEPQGEKLTIDDLIKPPGRCTRPPKLVLILRGLPGAGKTFIVKHIKSQESEMGGEAPRILTLDDYFECDGKVKFVIIEYIKMYLIVSFAF